MKEYIIDTREITKDFILERVKQEDIFKKYLGIDEINHSKLYINPLREDDETPSSSFSWDKKGEMLKFTDWPMRGKPNWSIDCFNLVQLIYDCTFKESLFKIYQHFNLINDDEKEESLIEIEELRKEVRKKNKKDIRVEIKNWNKLEITYWKEYYITEDVLSLYNVYPVRRLWINGECVYNYSAYDIAFVYFFGEELLKIYFPLRKKGEVRFIQNTSSILQGSQQLSLSSELCIITKSYKDVMALRGFGIESVAPLTETVIISPKQYNILSNRFENLFTLFDPDKSGIRSAVKHKVKYNIPILMFDKNQDEKDFSDNLKKYGINYMNDYIEETKQRFL